MPNAVPNAAMIVGYSGGIGSAIYHEIEKSEQFEKIYRLGRPVSSDYTLDYKCPDTIEAAAEQIKQNGIPLRFVIITTGLLHHGESLPEKSLRQINADWMAENFLVNATGPALVARHFLPIMPRKERIIFAVLSARVGSISDNRVGGWYSYRAAKAALNMIIKNLAIEVARSNPDALIVALHPGTVDTGLSAPFSGGGQQGGRFTPDEAAKRLFLVLEQLSPADSGGIFDYDGNIIHP
jgi:NAD(P)-dependent dehydrogenase (short-subunit alcohol dehydrogenase family)